MVKDGDGNVCLLATRYWILYFQEVQLAEEPVQTRPDTSKCCKSVTWTLLSRMMSHDASRHTLCGEQSEACVGLVTCTSCKYVRSLPLQGWRPSPQQRGNVCWCLAGGGSSGIPITSVTSSWPWRGPCHAVRQLKSLCKARIACRATLSTGSHHWKKWMRSEIRECLS